MIKRLTAKLKNEKKIYNFEQTNGVAGVCPDCGGIVTFNSYHQRYQCSKKECCFEANVEMERVWDNKMREENLKKLKIENQGLSI